ncbi:hypothetical protein CMUS01_13916 [Colletotrichum musicola]|uniref:Uncharacterized protein n=1 Tax=Colletotrichum musicola TaxID=2175873 RepID=A0A8H6J974_9PEZI|nr:hypothetical protein CMUS01_13916 [Colletotrichum musicola]
MLDAMHGDALTLDVFRYYSGPISITGDWEDQWFQVVCEPHFSYVPCSLTSDEEILYKRLAWIQDDAITRITKRGCAELPAPFPNTLLIVTFNGFVDTEKFPLNIDRVAGLDEVTANSSAVFRIWSRFPASEVTSTPKNGWHTNYVYAMHPKSKPHLKKKCEDYRAATTLFRKHGKKAYIVGYFYGFSDKKSVFTTDCVYNPLEFIPFIEIIKIDWAAAEPRQPGSSRDIHSSPMKPSTPSRGKGRLVFDPFAQMMADNQVPGTPSKSSKRSRPVDEYLLTLSRTDPQASELTIAVADQLTAEDTQGQSSKRPLNADSTDGGSDGPTPIKRSKTGSLRSRKRAL